ncbi:SDR family NAD(P)-dependent oxidoreductase [Microbacterium azadirachtae]|uniref:3-oxoacyl-[acyl-carrier-protein] reductase FabG n=1 Tax=Microbacterium azadirachtae TaxID=582680 RepID=A0A0F0LG03_9MICO|nr:SDR family oxidoreductase [Microbacterium azadirachtae]KJL32162.1 3-oxoacyl-[acyl-carrier-protein] reductase FabG [Microbacterium azadirachtae]
MHIKTTETRTLPIRRPPVFPVHEGKRIIVTGAAQGLGRAVAELLLAQGAKVVLMDIREDAIFAAAQELGGADRGVAAVAVDMSSAENVAKAAAAALRKFDGIDALANVAGIVRHSDPLQVPRSDWDAQFAVNVIGPYELSRLVAEHLISEERPGAIVNVASEAGKIGHAQSLAYSASKAALINETRMMSAALAYADININCVCPGGMPTAMLREVADAYSDRIHETAGDIFDAMITEQVGRHLDLAEVARTVSFLLSEDAFAIRGQAINVDGGGTPY